MPRKLTTAQKPFKFLVANLSGGGDPSAGVNPTVIRHQWEMQFLPELPNRGYEQGPVEDFKTPGLGTKMGLLATTVPDLPVHAQGSIIVSNNDFTNRAILDLGGYTLISNEHYTVAGTAADTATNIAASISQLFGFSASNIGATISVVGPFGPDGNDISFDASYEGSIQNFSLTPTDGSLHRGEPTIGPPEIT